MTLPFEVGSSPYSITGWGEESQPHPLPVSSGKTVVGVRAVCTLSPSYLSCHRGGQQAVLKIGCLQYLGLPAVWPREALQGWAPWLQGCAASERSDMQIESHFAGEETEAPRGGGEPGPL